MSGGVDSSFQQERAIAGKQNQLADSYLPIATDQNKSSKELYDLTKPGLDMAEGYYKKLASGDPAELQKAIAPATEKIIAGSEATKKNILDNTPRGGEQRLALEQTDIAKGAKIGDLSTQAYTGAFPALASLAGEGIGLSLNEVNAALSALGGSGTALAGAGNTVGNIANQQEAGKSSTMSLIGSLAGAAGTAAGGIYCWVAEAIYGRDDARTHVLRFWFTTVIPDSILARLYRRYGRRAARFIQKCGCARIIARWIFDRLLVMAWRDVHDAPVIRYSVGEEVWNVA